MSAELLAGGIFHPLPAQEQLWERRCGRCRLAVCFWLLQVLTNTLSSFKVCPGHATPGNWTHASTAMGTAPTNGFRDF